MRPIGCLLATRPSRPRVLANGPRTQLGRMGLRELEHFLGMFAGLFGEGHATEHARQLFDPLLWVEWCDLGLGVFLGLGFVDIELGLGAGGHLR